MGKIESQKEESEDGLNNVDDEINSEINYVRTFDLVKYFESSCQLEYNDLMRIFTQMDNKAQQVVTFSGVMLGFIVTFGKVDNLSYLRTISVWGIVFCIFVIILLMCSIGFSGSIHRTVSDIFFGRDKLHLPARLFPVVWQGWIGTTPLVYPCRTKWK